MFRKSTKEMGILAPASRFTYLPYVSKNNCKCKTTMILFRRGSDVKVKEAEASAGQYI